MNWKNYFLFYIQKLYKQRFTRQKKINTITNDTIQGNNKKELKKQSTQQTQQQKTNIQKFNMRLYEQQKEHMRLIFQYSFQQRQLWRINTQMDILESLWRLQSMYLYLQEKKYKDEANKFDGEALLEKKAQLLERELKKIGYQVGLEVLQRVDRMRIGYNCKWLRSRPGEVIAEAKKNNNLFEKWIFKQTWSRHEDSKQREKSLEKQIQNHEKHYHDLQCLDPILFSSYKIPTDQGQETISQSINDVRKIAYNQNPMPKEHVILPVKNKAKENQKSTSQKYNIWIYGGSHITKDNVDSVVEDIDDLNPNCFYELNDEKNQQMTKEKEQAKEMKEEGEKSQVQQQILIFEEEGIKEEYVGIEESGVLREVKEGQDVISVMQKKEQLQGQNQKKQAQQQKIPRQTFSVHSFQYPRVKRPLLPSEKAANLLQSSIYPHSQVYMPSQQLSSLIRRQQVQSRRQPQTPSIWVHLSKFQQELQSLVGNDLNLEDVMMDREVIQREGEN